MLALLGDLADDRTLHGDEEVLNGAKTERSDCDLAVQNKVVIRIWLTWTHDWLVVVEALDFGVFGDFKGVFVLVVSAETLEPRELFHKLRDLFEVRKHPLGGIRIRLVQLAEALHVVHLDKISLNRVSQPVVFYKA